MENPEENSDPGAANQQPQEPLGQPDTQQPGPQNTAQQFVQAQPTGYVVNPATGQLFYTVPVMQQPEFIQPGAAQFVDMAQTVQTIQQPYVAPQQPEVPAPNFEQVIKSVEQFAEGDATVADVVKTLYATTAQDDQFWKGAIVGAAATALLTSTSVGAAMGKTFDNLFGKSATKGKNTASKAAETSENSDTAAKTKKDTTD